MVSDAERIEEFVKAYCNDLEELGVSSDYLDPDLEDEEVVIMTTGCLY